MNAIPTTNPVSPMRRSRERRGVTQLFLAAQAHVALSTLRRAEVTGLVSDELSRRVARALEADEAERLSWRQHAIDQRTRAVLGRLGSPLVRALAAAGAVVASKINKE
jgi:hypothetical protein